MSDYQHKNTDIPRPRRQTQAHSSQGKSAHKTSRSRNSYGSDTAEIPVRSRPEEGDRYPRSEYRPIPRDEYERRMDAGETFDPRRNAGERRRNAADPYERRQEPRHTRRSPQKRRRSGCIGRFIRSILLLALILFALYSVIALVLISRVEKVGKGERSVTDGTLQASYVRNILLIGTDSRDLTEDRGRSDSMILLSVNSSAGKIYLTSFMRDCYVEIPGYGSDKLNAAYSYGGPELLMDTLEYNFDISIDDYLAVSFTGFAGIIDSFGGVEITVSDEEAQALNEILISEVNELMGDAREDDLLEGGGTYILDGKQALSYARIRYVGNADFERTSRQREVLEKLFANAKSRAAAAVPRLVSSALPELSTNMSGTELYLLSLRCPLFLGYDMVQQRVPAEETWWNDTINDQSVLQVDFEANKAFLQDTVFHN